MSIQDNIDVMRAFANGAQIEYRRGGYAWEVIDEPQFNWNSCEYRVVVELWFNKYSDNRMTGPYSSKREAYCGATRPCKGQVRLYEHPG